MVPELHSNPAHCCCFKLFLIIALWPESEAMPAELFLEQRRRRRRRRHKIINSLSSTARLLYYAAPSPTSQRSTRLILLYLCVCAIFGKKQNGECNRLTPFKLYRWGVQLTTKTLVGRARGRRMGRESEGSRVKHSDGVGVRWGLPGLPITLGAVC